MAKSITPYMNLLTTERQTSYNQGRSTIDILPLIQNSIQNEETHQLILIAISKEFDSIDRGAMWAILYQQGLPWKSVQQIKMGHTGTRLCAEHEEIIGKEIYNKGVYQESPISALLFIIYFDTVIKNTKQTYMKTSKMQDQKWK